MILYKVLEKSLRMLHPFMPFITEEIWQKLPHEKEVLGDSIMIQAWPHIQKQIISKEAEDDMAILIELVSSIRNMRSIWNVEPQKAIEAMINVHDKEKEAFIGENSDFMKRLGRISELEVGRIAKPKSSAVSIVRAFEVYLPLEGLIDFEKEKARLAKEEKRMEQEIRSLKTRLGDESFLSKAPKEVVENQRKHKEEVEAQLVKMRENIKEIG